MKLALLIALFVSYLAPAAHAADITVTQSRSTFDTEAVTIKAGDTIIFKNNDEYTHNIQVLKDDGETDDKGLQKTGEDIKYTFSKVGTYKILCSIHPKMRVVVTVQ